MASDLSSGVGFGILAPTPSVRGVEGNAWQANDEGKAPPRRERSSEKSQAEGEEPENPAEHQLDRLA